MGLAAAAMAAMAAMAAASLVLLAGCAREPATVEARPTAKASADPAPVKFVPPVRGDATPATPTSAPPAAPSPAADASPIAAVTPSSSPGKPPEVANRSYRPKDECAALPGFADFHSKLAAAARRHDAAAVTALSAPDVRLDFGGGAGREELRQRLASDRPELWGELQQLMMLGCAADGGLATMPWIFSRMPDSVDPSGAMLVVGDKVPVRARPSADATLLGVLDWALVDLAGDGFDPKARFSAIKAPDQALEGFVETARLRSLLDYRVIAEPQKEGWAITAFIAGD